MKNAAQVALAVVLGILVCVGVWFGYWALARQATTEQYQVNTNNQQYQASLVSQERDRVTAYYAAVDPAQKQAISSQFCQIYPTLNPPTADLIQAHAAICS